MIVNVSYNKILYGMENEWSELQVSTGINASDNAVKSSSQKTILSSLMTCL